MWQALSRFFGAIAGGITGLISGIPLAFIDFEVQVGRRLDWGLVGPAFPFAIIFGVIWGSISGFVRGVYTGATEGLLAGVKFPSTLYKHYWGVEDSNNELNSYIRQKDAKAYWAVRVSWHPDAHWARVINRFLAEDEIEDEIKEFTKYLESVENSELKAELQKEFDNYKAYLELKCPLTGNTVSQHGDPITIKNADQTVGVYDRSAVLKNMRYQGKTNAVGLETAHNNNSSFKKEEIVSTGLPERIFNFINDVRRRLKNLLEAQKSEKQLKADLGGVTLSVVNPAKKSEQEDKSAIDDRGPTSTVSYAKQYQQHGFIKPSPEEKTNKANASSLLSKPAQHKRSQSF